MVGEVIGDWKTDSKLGENGVLGEARDFKEESDLRAVDEQVNGDEPCPCPCVCVSVYVWMSTSQILSMNEPI